MKREIKLNSTIVFMSRISMKIIGNAKGEMQSLKFYD